MQPPKIYIVDDNDSVCYALKFLFDSSFNIPVEIYHSPLQFLDDYDAQWRGCLIIDLFLPFMDGLELLDNLRQRNNRIPVILMTGHGDKTMQLQARAKGASFFFSKPFNIDNLLKKIAEILTLENANNIV